MNKELIIKVLENALRSDTMKIDHKMPITEAMLESIIEVLKEPERKTGKWIDMGDFEQCSACTGTRLKEINTVYGKAIWIKSAYCPNCGVKMEE